MLEHAGAKRAGFFTLDVYAASPQMAALIAAHDWSRTPLGPPHRWPSEFRSILEVALANRFPMILWWGNERIQLYNDPYRPILGSKHPASLGQPGYECWHEIWDIIGPQIESVFAGGPSTWNEDLPLDMNRHGFLEETYFTFSYSPIPYAAAPGGIGGVLATVQEKTSAVVGVQRIRLLRDLAALGSRTKSVAEVCRAAVSTFAQYPRVVPLAALYLAEDSDVPRLMCASEGIGAPAPELWPFEATRETGEPVVVDVTDERVEHPAAAPWPEPIRRAVVVPIAAASGNEPAGYLVGGVSPRRELDADYVAFFTLAARQLSSALANARAYEFERRRAEDLAALDRAKTTFFSNVSHEFRTPLTLMLGPLAELSTIVDKRAQPLVDIASRNALRLLKLVNTLLDFSRLESTRHDAQFALTDIGALTADLCALFRSAIENAGLRFDVQTATGTSAYVDRTMYEKIVFNLLSNALKYTFEGSIRVRLHADASAVILTVADTGVGIDDTEVPRLFERFHRVVGARSRSHEGSGIGLALVVELVRMHAGTVSVESAIGEGSTFTVRLPLGRAHIVPENVVEAPAVNDSIAGQYLADLEAAVSSSSTQLPVRAALGDGRPRVLVADDNADLRAYLVRILEPHHDVVAVANGAQGLAALRTQSFDCIVSDVMMPEVDGFEFLRAVRSDPQRAATPFIMLSARAGEEAAVEGLVRGADDYLSKPFTAEELLARVTAHLNAVAIRAEAVRDLALSEQRFRTLAASMPHIVVEADASGAITFLSDAWEAYTGLSSFSGMGFGWNAAIHPDDAARTDARWRAAAQSGATYHEEMRIRRRDGAYRWFVAHILPQRGAKGEIVRWTGTVTDIDDQRRAVTERDFLSNAGRLLAQSLDLQTTLANIAKLTVPAFGDWCHISLRTADDRIQTVAVAHRDPEKNQSAQQYVGQSHLDPRAEVGTAGAISHGCSSIIDDIGSLDADEPRAQSELGWYRELGNKAAAFIPLVAQGETLGAIAVAFDDRARRTYSPDDLPVLEELGRRAGLAVRNASRYEREHRVAETFQAASLPPELPTVRGVSFDAMYRPASDDARVGGDWYDALRLVDGRILISIGDVTGNGLQAAVTMGNMRQIIRGIAQVHADPSLILDAADRALRLEHPDQLVTAFVGVLDPIAESFTYASAGHPAPIMRLPDGSIALLSDGGLPLGLRENREHGRGRAIGVRPGSQLVCYTDGLTEARRRPLEDEERLCELVAEGSVLREPHPAQALAERFFCEDGPRDDVAILVVNIAEIGTRQPLQVERWSLDAGAQPDAFAEVRRAVARSLRQRGASDERIAAAELVCGELLGNVARHAPGAVDVAVDWSLDRPVLHVFDEGPGFTHVPALPHDPLSESGRGLFLVKQLSDDFRVTRRVDGGSHACAVLGAGTSCAPGL